MDDQIILVSDDKGNFTGEYIPKNIGHSGLGKRHLAITVLIYNILPHFFELTERGFSQSEALSRLGIDPTPLEDSRNLIHLL